MCHSAAVTAAAAIHYVNSESAESTLPVLN